MPILDPVSPFLALIDRVISLIRERQTRKQEYFEKIVDPLYAQFKPLAEDCLEQFRDAESLAKNSKNRRDFAHAAEIVNARREEFANSRAHLRALIDECSKHGHDDYPELAEFLQAMLRFFSPQEASHGDLVSDGFAAILALYRPTSNMSLLTVWFNAWRLHRDSGVLQQYVSETKSRLDAAWIEVARVYMNLKLRYVVNVK